jgi:cytochrome c peroxidase
MMVARTITIGLLVLLMPTIGGTAAGAEDFEPEPIEELGDELFEDENLSINQNQSCAACHDPAYGKTGGIDEINAAGAVYEGSIPGRFGDRKPPSSAYATLSPIFHFAKQAGGLWIGGNFWDGRATGEKLGNPAADQAQGPFLNPVEQALPDSACVVYRVSMGAYADLYGQVWGDNIFTIDFPPDTDNLCGQEGMTIPLSPEDRAKVEMEYDNIALSIAAYEDSPGVNQFNSKFDASRGGKIKLTKQERRGFALFQGKGKCARCHVSSGRKPAFTDFTYDNLGVPPNPQNPALVADPSFVDPGLGGFLMSRGEAPEVWEPEIGKMKVPTLRNVDKRPTPDAIKAYTHNGYFKTLKGVVNFYNTRDVKDRCPGLFTEAQALAANCWPAPEVAQNVNTSELGDLGLTGEEEDAIVAFLKTLTDQDN